MGAAGDWRQAQRLTLTSACRHSLATSAHLQQELARAVGRRHLVVQQRAARAHAPGGQLLPPRRRHLKSQDSAFEVLERIFPRDALWDISCSRLAMAGATDEARSHIGTAGGGPLCPCPL